MVYSQLSKSIILISSCTSAMSSAIRRARPPVHHDSNASDSSTTSSNGSESELVSSSSSKHEASFSSGAVASSDLHDENHSSPKRSGVGQSPVRYSKRKQTTGVQKTRETLEPVEDCYIKCKYTRDPISVSHCEESVGPGDHTAIHHCAPSKQHGSSTIFTTKNMFIFVFMIVASAVAYVFATMVPSRRSSPSPDAATSFIVHMQDMELLFTMQSAVFWRILRAGTKPTFLLENPHQPATFILVIPSDAVSTGECLTKQFSRLVTTLLGAKPVLEFRSSDVTPPTPQKVKRDLDNTLNEGFSYGSRVAVIHHLEQLHGESAMMLHSYCDNENAPFRNVVFILTLYVQETSSMISETDQFVENQLSALWYNDLGANRFDPLLSRIANSVAFVRSETNEVLKQNKC